ncbi:MAG TPA: hypothetical protein VNO32_26145, partial [Candidatus Acidoferrum sp.]|nr:hypothetical protein [Candidatus Acidoferrum sp.]
HSHLLSNASADESALFKKTFVAGAGNGTCPERNYSSWVRFAGLSARFAGKVKTRPGYHLRVF